MNEADTILSTKEVADMLGTSVATLVTWRQTKQGPKWFRVGSRLVRYLTSEVGAWLLEQQNRAH